MNYYEQGDDSNGAVVIFDGEIPGEDDTQLEDISAIKECFLFVTQADNGEYEYNIHTKDC